MSSQDCFRVPVLLVAVSHRVLFITVDLARGACRSGSAMVAARLKTTQLLWEGSRLGRCDSFHEPKGKRGGLISSGGCLVGEPNICAAPLSLLLCTRSEHKQPQVFGDSSAPECRVAGREKELA